VRYLGEPVALVAAPDRETLAAALAAITADVEPQTPFVGIDAVAEAMRRDPASLHDLYALTISKGDVTRGLAEADAIVEGEYLTAPQEHAYLEPQAMAATPRPDGSLRIFGSLQCPYYVQPSVALALGLEPQRIVVEQCATGGPLAAGGL
jgi:CO/xanthine dehydrogenase Mo-binding subunit